ncbi:hypothetical protein KIK06_05525 [Nocardiopsis sp. EMB25]|uniref:hypothetical protein n=1 Tax=Nocardiopsis sp. EMB25 TaxID=2835867 RepID=UPI002284A991|nr:hypothetical protein [Nocardiopsis sp. EMB25]MCY9783354.1 hypothetical protein [Nocardiopsis sp. EMB25]
MLSHPRGIITSGARDSSPRRRPRVGVHDPTGVFAMFTALVLAATAPGTVGRACAATRGGV